MLEVMTAGSVELGHGRGDTGMLLNCWDKSTPLIKELEQTVNFAERKYGDLMQELHYYREYYKKWAQSERIRHICHKKKSKKNHQQNHAENHHKKHTQNFHRNIQSKMNEIENEINQVHKKISSKVDDSPPLANKLKKISQEEPESLYLNLEEKECRSEPVMASCDEKSTMGGLKVTSKQSSKSVPARGRVLKPARKDSGVIRKRFSSLQRYKLRSKSLPQGVRRKFGFGGFFEVFEPESLLLKSKSKSKTLLITESSKSFKNRKSKTRLEMKRLSPETSRRVLKSTSDVKNSSTELKRNDSVHPVQKPMKENTCKEVVPTGSIAELDQPDVAVDADLKTLMTKPNALVPFLRHPIPFIPCSSTSKTFNLGLNVQQVLSLIKHKKHTVSLQAIVKNSIQAARSLTEPRVNTLFISQTTTSHSQLTSAICPARDGSEDSFSIFTDNRSKCSILKQVQTLRSQSIQDHSECKTIMETMKPERPEDVWVVEQPDSREVRSTRSRCTCFPSKHCVDYHKVLRQYTGWKLPSVSQAGTQSTYLCTKSKMYTIPSQENLDCFEDNDGRIELMKVHNDLLNLTRKYLSLQEQISQNGLNDFDANAELDAMETELAMREIEFKDILNFYNQLMVLKEKLKSLRKNGGNHSKQQQHQLESRRPKKDPLRPTPSMALAKVLRKIQGLQDKIKLMDAP